MEMQRQEDGAVPGGTSLGGTRLGRAVRDGADWPTAATQGSAAGAGTWQAASLLDDSVAQALVEANAGFIERLAARVGTLGEGADERTQPAVFGLPLDGGRRVLRLLGPERHRLAGAHFALFDLRFGDALFWSTALRSPPVVAESRVTGDTTRWVREAVVLAWHLAQRGDLAAALTLGMTPAVQSLWSTMRLGALDAAAVAAEGVLQARWAGHPRLWPQLLGAVERNDPAALAAARHLGWQLLATDGLRPAMVRRRGLRADIRG